MDLSFNDLVSNTCKISENYVNGSTKDVSLHGRCRHTLPRDWVTMTKCKRAVRRSRSRTRRSTLGSIDFTYPGLPRFLGFPSPTNRVIVDDEPQSLVPTILYPISTVSEVGPFQSRLVHNVSGRKEVISSSFDM